MYSLLLQSAWQAGIFILYCYKVFCRLVYVFSIVTKCLVGWCMYSLLLQSVQQAGICILYCYSVQQAGVCILHCYSVQQACVCILYCYKVFSGCTVYSLLLQEFKYVQWLVYVFLLLHKMFGKLIFVFSIDTKCSISLSLYFSLLQNVS